MYKIVFEIIGIRTDFACIAPIVVASFPLQGLESFVKERYNGKREWLLRVSPKPLAPVKKKLGIDFM